MAKHTAKEKYKIYSISDSIKIAFFGENITSFYSKYFSYAETIESMIMNSINTFETNHFNYVDYVIKKMYQNPTVMSTLKLNSSHTYLWIHNSYKISIFRNLNSVIVIMQLNSRSQL